LADKFFYARNGLQVAPNTRLIVPVGNTAQRPGSPQNGDFRYNSDTGFYEGYYTSNTSWAAIGTTALPTDPQFTTVSVGNSSVNTFINSTSWNVGPGMGIVNSTGLFVGVLAANATAITAGANVVINTSSVGIGNSTVSVIANSTAVLVGNTLVSPTQVKVGNSTVFASMNATNFTGTANNATNLGGVASGSYALTSALSAYQTTSGLASAVSVLAANNATYLGGISYASYWRQDTLVYLSQLNNNVGYITGLSSGGGYSVSTLSAGNYLYSSGNVYAVGDVYAAYSDLRLKTILGSIHGALDKVDSLNGVYYVRNPDVAPELAANDPDKVKVGLVAQDVLAVVPEAVSFVKDVEGNDTEYLTVQYERLVPLLVEAIKELRAEVNELRRKS
jgi:hypothetical protein